MGERWEWLWRLIGGVGDGDAAIKKKKKVKFETISDMPTAHDDVYDHYTSEVVEGQRAPNLICMHCSYLAIFSFRP